MFSKMNSWFWTSECSFVLEFKTKKSFGFVCRRHSWSAFSMWRIIYPSCSLDFTDLGEDRAYARFWLLLLGSQTGKLCLSIPLFAACDFGHCSLKKNFSDRHQWTLYSMWLLHANYAPHLVPGACTKTRKSTGSSACKHFRLYGTWEMLRKHSPFLISF